MTTGREHWWTHYKDSLFRISRNAKLYLLGSLLLGVTHANFQLLFNLYLREQGAGESTIGDVLAWTARGAALMALPAGLMLMRIRLKPVLLTITSTYALAAFLMARTEDLSTLWMFAILSGMSLTFLRVAGAPFYMRNSTSKERPLLFSLGFGMMILSGTIGSLGAGFLVSYFDAQLGDIVLAHRYALYAGISVGIAALIPFALIKSKPPSREESNQILAPRQILKRMPLYLKLFTPYFLVGSGAGLIIPFLNIYFRDRFDKSADEIGVYFFGVQAAMFIGTMAAPVLVRSIGRIKTIVITELISIPFMIALAYTTNTTVAVVAFLLRGAFMNMGQPVSTNFGMEIVTHREQGMVNAIMHLAWTSSWSISTYFGGTLIENYGYELPLLLSAGLYVLAALIYYIFFRSYETHEEGQYVINGGELRG